MELKVEGHNDAMITIRDNGFTDITPEEGMLVHKTFEKDGRLFKFAGWCHRCDAGFLSYDRLMMVQIS